jgi:hypothetical protein
VTPQASDLLWQLLGQGFEPALEGGAPRGETPPLREKPAHELHLGGGFFEHREQFAHFVQSAEEHDQQGFEEEALRVDDRSPARAALRRERGWDTINQTDQLHQYGVLSDHERASGESELGHTPYSEAFRVGSSPDAAFSIYDQASVS